MCVAHHPRSTLHALSPIGQESANVESLTSYFCRLAHSHGMTARNLAAWTLAHFDRPIPDDFKWFRRAFSGMSPETEEWAAWLADLTGVANLDRLTLAPWRHLVSNPGLAPISDRWCPLCLKEDLAQHQSPYLRLAWDLAPVKACLTHRVEFASLCPHCGKSNVRNRTATVVVGYCTSCGGFLGDAKSPAAEPLALWVARQVAQMLERPPRVAADGVTRLLESVVERMADGNVAAFARQMNLSKSGVWHWVRKGGVPTLGTWLAISLRGGIGLGKLFAGELSDWVLPEVPAQVSMQLSPSPRKNIQSRDLDWDGIRQQLIAILNEPVPITLAEACRRTGVEHKLLYLRANSETRAIADRYRRFQAACRAARQERFEAQVEQLVQERIDAGYEGISAQDLWPSLDDEAKSVRHSFRQVAKVIAAKD